MRISTTIAAFVAASLAISLVPAQTWTQQSPTTSPGPRRAGAMVFDVASNRLLLNGGTTSSPGQILSETWGYNGANWTLLAPATAAPARWGHQLVRDTTRNRLITFGGRSPSLNGLANDTWSWSGTTWSALAPTLSPPARFRYGMVYDNRRDRVVLFGGRRAINNANDTWEFNGINWSQVTTATAPSPREDMVMAFDGGTGMTVVFGGYDNDTATLLGDTWEYRGTWRQVTPAASPSPRYRCGGVYDALRKRIVIYGGYDGTAYRTETFAYSGSAWDAVTVGPGTTNPTEMYTGFDSVRNRFVTFGGVGAAFSGQTWEYAGAGTAMFGSFGVGCPHSSGTAVISGTPPVLGAALQMQVNDIPVGATVALVAQGFSSAVWNGGTLPFDLTPFGLTGCVLEVRDDGVIVVLANAMGEIKYGFTIPNTPTLVNLAYYTQALVLDPQAPNGTGGMSRPSRAIFGN